MLKRSALILTIGLWFLAGCGGGDGSEATQQPAVKVVTQKAEKTVFPVTLKVGGTIKGDRQTMIPGKVQTSVARIPARPGYAVKEGELLVMLDPGGVTSQYRQAEAVYLNAEKQFHKMESLYQTGAVSETQLDGAETEFKVAAANFDAAKRAIEIVAPFDGVVTDIYVRVGDEVAPGMPLVEIADVSALRLVLEVSATQVGQLKVGQKVKVASTVDSSVVMAGSVHSVADAASTTTRSFEVECRFAQPRRGFAPGMYVVAEIETQVLNRALVVPNDAVMYRSGRAQIYVLDDDSAVLVPVEIIASADGKTAVKGNLQAGQPVVVDGQKNLTPGAKVQEVGQ